MKGRLPRWVLPAIAACAGISACRKEAAPGRFPHLDITVSYPATGAFRDFASVCSGAAATLVSFDTDADRGFEYRFLFDASGEVLWGCGNAPCDGPIEKDLPVPRRVMIEGITVTPAEYGVRRHDVACRGIADPAARMGEIVVSPMHFPGLDDTVHVEVPMVRVGAFNGMFDATGPTAPGMAAALLIAEEHREEVSGDLRVSTGGVVVAAGGYEVPDPNRPAMDVWEFHPWEIAWERTATTTTGHFYGNAESFLDASGEPGVIFVGGLGTNQRGVFQADAYRRGKGGTDPYLTAVPRFFPGVARVRDREEPAIAVLGGCYGASALDSYQQDFEYFFPAGRPAGCAGAGSPGFCTPAPSVMVEGRCQGGLASLPGGRLWFGTGLRDDGLISDYAYVFDGSAAGAFGEPVADVQTPVRLPATVPLADDVVALFGGILTPPTLPIDATDRWVAFDPLTGTLANGTLRQPRGYATATMLLDGRILVAGGIDGAGALDSAEIFERGNEEIGGQFEHLAPAGTATCTPGLDCEKMSEARYAHAATRIVGSSSWLEGSVLITGGSLNVSAGTSEIFVPPYYCDGAAKPVNRLDGARVPDVELCDRLRDPLKLTDPRNPKRL